VGACVGVWNSVFGGGLSDDQKHAQTITSGQYTFAQDLYAANKLELLMEKQAAGVGAAQNCADVIFSKAGNPSTGRLPTNIQIADPRMQAALTFISSIIPNITVNMQKLLPLWTFGNLNLSADQYMCEWIGRKAFDYQWGIFNQGFTSAQALTGLFNDLLAQMAKGIRGESSYTGDYGPWANQRFYATEYINKIVNTGLINTVLKSTDTNQVNITSVLLKILPANLILFLQQWEKGNKVAFKIDPATGVQSIVNPDGTILIFNAEIVVAPGGGVWIIIGGAAAALLMLS
jgi:hypothetical protein